MIEPGERPADEPADLPVPALHDLAVAVCAPATLLSSPDGEIRPGGAQGWYVDDVRLLSGLVVSVDGSPLEPVRVDVGGTTRHSVDYVARRLGGWMHDPTVALFRRRTLGPDTLVEEVEVVSRAPRPIDLRLHVDLESDLAPTVVVRQGRSAPPVAPTRTEHGLAWGDGESGCTVEADPAASVEGGRMTWSARVEPGASYSVTVRCTAHVDAMFQHESSDLWARVESSDPRIAKLARQSASDLSGLLLRDGEDDVLAAGAPWFLTLFGRDALWSARLLMPFGTDLALSTLRSLARRQGVRTDPVSQEQPGKILHELRGAELDFGGLRLPPVYYGSVDATPLFVCTLADAWRAGADRDEVRALVPSARRGLEWMLDQSRESGWLRYVDTSGTGLSNQGWKDSRDSVRHADGSWADPPIALCEVQGYAYEAATRGADLLDDLGEPPVPGLREWAADLRTRFEREFWVETPQGGHVPIALDGSGEPAGSMTSNMGHLLGTGLLTATRIDRVVEVLTSREMDSGFGLRTLACDASGYSPLSYHVGSVWPHDTAIAVRGLALEGRHEAAARLARGVLEAAEGFGYRLPELYGGDDRSDVPAPSAYPAACRPQAWAAAGGLACAALLARTDRP